ncbi:urokinase plasminogen activator surface receptor-like isoform X2 [Mustelus asterias]
MEEQSKVKLFSAVLIICALLIEVRPLTCNQCSGLSGSCTFTAMTCRTGITTCSTTSTTTTSEVETRKQVTNACGPCSDPISFNFGSLVISQSSSCCASDHCNQQIDTEPVNNTLTGLKCRRCFGRSFNSCRDSEQTVNCVGAENRCVNASGVEAVLTSGERFFAKGCVSEQICQSPNSMEEQSILFDGQPACCTGNLCNGDPQGGTSTAEPASTLKCVTDSDSCDNPTGNCTQQEVCDPAQNLNCRTISATLTLGGVLQKSLINGCGNCTGNLSFNSRSWSVDMMEQCCQSDFCNNQIIAEKANTTLNGLECYVCPTPTAGTCEDSSEMVKCAGLQTRCFNSSVMYLRQNYSIKGCASESLCENPDAVRILQLQPQRDFYCCNRSGCNHRSPNITAQIMADANNGVANNDNPSVRPLLALTLIILMPCLF